MNLIKIILATFGTIGVIIGVPLLVINSLNVLFKLSIPFTFETWIASFVLSAIMSGSITACNKYTD